MALATSTAITMLDDKVKLGLGSELYLLMAVGLVVRYIISVRPGKRAGLEGKRSVPPDGVEPATSALLVPRSTN